WTGMSRYVVCTIQSERKKSKFEARFTDSVRMCVPGCTRTIAAAGSNAPDDGCLWVSADPRHALNIRKYSWPPRS
ncbi:hypothetical protein FA95DRAFT_1568193, partial [Auriscalpium vulgare]